MNNASSEHASDDALRHGANRGVGDFLQAQRLGQTVIAGHNGDDEAEQKVS